MNLRNAKDSGDLERFISERVSLEAPKSTLQRYIDASATPLDSRKEGQSELIQGSDYDCK